jgi:hypothetical protein
VCSVSQLLAANTKTPNKLKRHLETKHSEMENKPEKYFRRKLDEIPNPVSILSNVIQNSAEQEGVHGCWNCDTPCCDRHGTNDVRWKVCSAA